MSTPWYAGWAEPYAEGGASSPYPIPTNDPSWSWDVEFAPVTGSLYARASLNSFGNVGGGSGWCGAGLLQYRTRNKHGQDTVHSFEQQGGDGYADFVWDSNIDSVTFGWTIEGDNYCQGRINLEIWI